MVKDATVALEQLINALPVNQDTSLQEPNVKLHVNQTISEMEITDAENAQILARLAHQPLLVPHVSNQEISQLMVSATLAFIHAPLVQHTNNVPAA